MDWDKLANHAGGTLIALTLIYLLADNIRESRDILLQVKQHVEVIYHTTQSIQPCKPI
jgi:hypothetical protein